MIWKTVLVAALACFACAICLAVFTGDAHAQAKKPDAMGKGMAKKEGVAGSLGNKEFDKAKLPGKPQIAFAVGSLIAAIAVLKYA